MILHAAVGHELKRELFHLSGEAEVQKLANIALFDVVVMLGCMAEYYNSTSMVVLPMKLSYNINNIIIKRDKYGMRKICEWFCKKSSFTVGIVGIRLMV